MRSAIRRTFVPKYHTATATIFASFNSSSNHNCFLMTQMLADLAEQGIGGLGPESRDETRGLPLSDSRYPKGATIAGDETKIR